MLTYGSKEWLLDEAHRATGAIRRFPCPRCKRKKGERCVRPGGYREVRTHPEREALWKEYCYDAPKKLAWLEAQGLPWLDYVISEYLISGKRPKRRKIDIGIAERRLEEIRLILEEKL